jgi:hypothetical protein
VLPECLDQVWPLAADFLDGGRFAALHEFVPPIVELLQDVFVRHGVSPILPVANRPRRALSLAGILIQYPLTQRATFS